MGTPDSTEQSYDPLNIEILLDNFGPNEDISATTTAEQRIAMVWELTKRKWASMGQPLDGMRLQRNVVSFRRLDHGAGSEGMTDLRDVFAGNSTSPD